MAGKNNVDSDGISWTPGGNHVPADGVRCAAHNAIMAVDQSGPVTVTNEAGDSTLIYLSQGVPLQLTVVTIEDTDTTPENIALFT